MSMAAASILQSDLGNQGVCNFFLFRFDLLTNSLEGQESLGEDNLRMVANMLMPLSLWPFLRVGDMSPEQYRALITGAASELRDASKKLYYKV